MKSEPTFLLPEGFISRGWVHVLEDSEINVLLMAACGWGGLSTEDGAIAVPSEVRLRRYGISRDSFGAAHPMLEKFGLLSVIEVGRHDDGRSVGYGEDGAAHVHRLRLLPGGFEEDAFPKVSEVIEQELARAAPS